MKKGDEVICIKDCFCNGSARFIKEGEKLIIKGINGHGRVEASCIWFLDTLDGHGSYDINHFELLFNFKTKEYEIY